MSSQKSDLPIRSNGHSTAPHAAVEDLRQGERAHPGKIDLGEHKSFEVDPYASPAIYYGESHGPRKPTKTRTFSSVDGKREPSAYSAPSRRTSVDPVASAPRKFLVNVQATLDTLLSREDSDGNFQITIEDKGPKVISLGSADSGGYRSYDVRGTYMLSNLLQELTLAKQYGRKQIVLDEARLNENPVKRLSRLIKDSFWNNLTRRIDGSNVARVGKDPKDWTDDPRPRIYIPVGAPEQHQYYTRVAKEHPEMRLDVIWLNEKCDDDDYVRDLNEAPGLLAIEMERVEDTPAGEPDYRGLPFVVPGGRFNELYGWDSYMETLGLLVNGRADLGESMVRHFCFCIRHYGKILNANRTYYLCRSQPPFLTDMAIRVYEHIQHKPYALDFLRKATLAAIKDYHNTWTSLPRYDAESGFTTYHAGGRGVPPETEASHFVHVCEPYAKKHGMTFKEFVKAYNYGDVVEPELDSYFVHDRAVRESGHDTSYRLENKAADLATVDLNSCLYKYEMDIARLIRSFFGDKLEIPVEWRSEKTKDDTHEFSSTWERRARRRRAQMDKCMWDEEKGMYFDYDIKKKEHTGYESATTFWAMWAGVCTPKQASLMVERALPKFENLGGLASGTEESRGPVGLSRPNRQWDFPFGWAPQQLLAWIGLQRYKFDDEAKRLAYRWVYMVTRAFVDFNGVVVEKYDVTNPSDPHRVTAEYGNQGSDFKGVATEGFGWVNASYVYGLNLIDDTRMQRALGTVTDWDTYKKMTDLKDGLLDEKHEAEARAELDKISRAAVRRASVYHAASLRPQALAASAQAVNESPLDAHQGPHPSSDHASG